MSKMKVGDKVIVTRKESRRFKYVGELTEIDFIRDGREGHTHKVEFGDNYYLYFKEKSLKLVENKHNRNGANSCL